MMAGWGRWINVPAPCHSLGITELCAVQCLLGFSVAYSSSWLGNTLQHLPTLPYSPAYHHCPSELLTQNLVLGPLLETSSSGQQLAYLHSHCPHTPLSLLLSRALQGHCQLTLPLKLHFYTTHGATEFKEPTDFLVSHVCEFGKASLCLGVLISFS